MNPLHLQQALGVGGTGEEGGGTGAGFIQQKDGGFLVAEVDIKFVSALGGFHFGQLQEPVDFRKAIGVGAIVADAVDDVGCCSLATVP
jgi:hypothetical protein